MTSSKPKTVPSASHGKSTSGKVRLQKIMAAAGLGSRRACEQMILDGLVEVDGQAVDKLPVLVDPQRQKVFVNGQKLAGPATGTTARQLRPEKLVYYLLHKPKGVICTNRHPSDSKQVLPGRLRAVDLMRGVKQRLVSVGRLDVESRGLLIMTNDGELVNRLTHPRHEVPKTYRLRIDGYLKQEDIDRMKKGVWLTKGRPGPARIQSAGTAKVNIIHRDRSRTMLEVVLKEGRNRQIRRVMARLGYKVRDLLRIKIGPISLKGLPAGKYRLATYNELQKLGLH